MTKFTTPSPVTVAKTAISDWLLKEIRKHYPRKKNLGGSGIHHKIVQTSIVNTTILLKEKLRHRDSNLPWSHSDE